MPIASCRHCNQRIEYPASLAGQDAQCPSCNKVTSLPGADTTPAIRVPKFEPRGQAQREPGQSTVSELADRLIRNIEQVVVGKYDRVRLVVMALLADGHVLLEDVPGVAKTMLARALAQSTGCSFKRVQCTPDLLPNDITGASVFNPKTTEFEFRPGPLFAQIVLADEINRATPRTQAALLEAMAERQVTADGRIYPLAPPFFLISTQNPVDHEGTFPLPEAQLDRFLVRLSLGYPGLEQEIQMLERLQHNHPIDTLQPAASVQEILDAQAAVRAIHVHAKVREYIAKIVRATRQHDAVLLGASPRASAAVCRAAQALAAMQGFDFVLPDDVKAVAGPVLTHRLILRPESRLRKATAGAVLTQVIDSVDVPVVTPGAGNG